MEQHKVSRADLVSKLHEIITASTSDPAEDLIRIGKVLESVGEALKGRSPADARAAIQSVAHLV